MPLYQVISGAGGSKELVEVGAGGGSETWGVHVDALPADPSALIADLPVGAFVTDNEGGGADLEPRVVALEEDMTAVTQTVTAGDTSKTTVAAHQDENGIYGVATATKYGHVRLSDEATASDASMGVALTPKGALAILKKETNWAQGNNSNIGSVLSDGGFLITASGTFTVPATGLYQVQAVGGGGNGGTSTGASGLQGGGGGGGAGQTVSTILALTNAATVSVTVGAAGGNTVFSTVTALAGGAGGASSKVDGMVRGGALGTNYGVGGSAGGSSGSKQASDYAYMNYGGSGASSTFGINSGNTYATAGQSVPASYAAAAGAPGKGYGGGGGGGCGGYTSQWSGSYATRSGGRGAPGAVYLLRIG